MTDKAGPFWLLLAGQVAPAVACTVGITLVGANGSLALDWQLHRQVFPRENGYLI